MRFVAFKNSRTGGFDTPSQQTPWVLIVPTDNVNIAAPSAWSLGADEPTRRLDQALAASAFAGENRLSRTRLKALIGEGAVACDSRVVTDPAFKVGPGAAISVTLPEAEPSELIGESRVLDIRYEDDDLLVLDKPAGLVVHPAPGHATGTLVQALIAHCGDSLSGVGGVRRPGIVHRLDKDTSGLLVVAKNDAAHQGLAEQFADHGRSGPLLREYRAFVWGALPATAGTIDAPLARHATFPGKCCVRRTKKRGDALATRLELLATHCFPAAWRPAAPSAYGLSATQRWATPPVARGSTRAGN